MIRASLHLFQFIVAYFIMLLAMSFNGYILFSIFIGVFLGFVMFEWEWIDCPGTKEDDGETGCCG